MALLLVTTLFMSILLWVSWGYVRSRDPLLRDVMWIFTSVALLFVLAVARMLGGELPRPVAGVLTGLLLAQPVLTLRLVSRLRRVPAWALSAATAGWLASAVPVVLLGRPLPRWVVLLAIAVFFVVEMSAAWLLAGEARRRGGAARTRLWCAAAGTALFGVALMIAGGGPSTTALSRGVAAVSALMYVLAFAPPRRLRQTWSRSAAYGLIRRLLEAPVQEPPEWTWRRYCEGACEVVGADGAMVLLGTTPGVVEPIAEAGLTGAGVHGYRDSEIRQLLAMRTTVDLHAGRVDAPPVAAEVAAGSGARFVTTAPLTVSGRQGAVVLLNRHRTLFTDDDIALFTELAAQAATIAGRAAAMAERQRLAVIVESSHDAIIGKTLDGIITSWNVGAQRLYGYTAAEVVGQHAAMLFPAGQPQTEAELMDRIAAGARIEQYEVQRRRKDGATMPVSLTLSPITDPGGRVVGVASISRDLSGRQRAEAMFRGLLEAAPDAIIGVTQDGNIALINAQAERLFGYQRAELLGQPIELLVPEQVRAGHPQHREHYFAHAQPRPMGAGMALAAVRKDGSEFPAEISLSALQTDQGVIVSAAIRDVTERLEAQAERERLTAQAERDAEERRMQHTRRLESLGQLAGGVAHDFNNILAVIGSYTELGIEILDSPAPSRNELVGLRADLLQVSRAAESATRLTKQLLAFGRRDITQAEVLVVNDVIGEVEQMLRRAIGEHITLVTDLSPQLWPVLADSSQIEQILVNVAVNARDAMPGGGTLSIDTSNTRLDEADVAAKRDLTPGRYVRVRVSDSGAGMSPEIMERAFEPFYTTKPHGAGTGLGLATVYGIVVAAGGDVRLYSKPGIGTTITILLPATEVAAHTGGSPNGAGTGTSPPEGSRGHETILLVEDEDPLRDVTTRILARAGYQVLAANNGAAAVELAQHHPGPIHLLLTDVIMPKMMGNEVAARVAAIRPRIPVLYMSGYAQPVLTEHGTLQPGVTLIEKPFASGQLLHRIATALHTWSPARNDATAPANR
jgi:PAS domain S-box-containing protein